MSLPSGFIVTSNGVPCRLDGISFSPPVLAETSPTMRDFPARVFKRTRDANTAIRRTCLAQAGLDKAVFDLPPFMKRLCRMGNFRVVSLREQAKKELDANQA
jgi:hypothetical protein